MFSLAYTVSPTLRDGLQTIDHLRTRILVTPIPLLLEQKLRWKAAQNDRLSHTQRVSFGMVRADWVANPKQITANAISDVVERVFPDKKRAITRSLAAEEPEIRTLCRYLSSQNDHPTILGGIMYGSLSETASAASSDGLLPLLLSYLLLTKFGYDCRGMLPLDVVTATIRDRTALHGQLTIFLEHFVQHASASYEALFHEINQSTTNVAPILWPLSIREKRILALLENPAVTITNRDIQNTFRVSGVTASRTLSRLTAFGLLYAHGKGRSVYYTKL